MTVLLIATIVVASASIFAIGCVAHVLISFRRSGHLLASRVGRQPLALVVIAGETSARRQPSKARSVAARRQLRLQPIAS
jgi:hypothetical protein